jgi:hypothetical protein
MACPDAQIENQRHPPWRVGLQTRCGHQPATTGVLGLEGPAPEGPSVTLDAVLLFCRDGAARSGPNLDLRLLVRGAAGQHENPETIGLSLEQLRGRLLVFEFGPAWLDIVLTTPDYRDVVRLHRSRSPRTGTPSLEAT